MKWIVILLVFLLYVHLFNRIARLHLDAGRSLQLQDLWTRWFPYRMVRIE